jgi:phosphotransferase system enzyme I (PtsI)
MDSQKQIKPFRDADCGEIVLEGITICPGIGIGEAHILREYISVPRIQIESGQVDDEHKRYTKAMETVIENLHKHIEDVHGYSLTNTHQIFKVHELMAKDEQFHGAVLKRISSEHKNAEWAIFDESKNIIKHLEASRDAYLQARVEDVLDLVNNILAVLSLSSEARDSDAMTLHETQVLVSANLYASHIIKANRSHVQAFATESSAFSSHAAILLKSYGIPAIGGIKDLKTSAKNGDRVIIDGMSGLVIIRPCPGTLRKYCNLEKQQKRPAEWKKYRPIEMLTNDGTGIQLLANIDNHHQVDLVLRNNLEGIGLFRTEFLILTSNRFPNEEEQYEIYRRVVEVLLDRHLVFRTFDLGADKIMPGLERCTGKNPALGVRGIRRHLLHHPEELHVQLRAIIRAASGTTIGILFPMVTTINDIIEIKREVEKVKEELRSEGKPFSSHVKLGAMIEVPAAAIAIQDVLEMVDFVSVGTNDLIQYFMAADRDNEAVLHYGDNTNKSFVYLLRFMIERAAELGRAGDVTICGEMASDPRLIPLLIDMGYRSFSITAVSAPSIREVISNIDLTVSSKNELSIEVNG